MDEIVSDLPDLTDLTLRDLTDPPPDLREVLDQAAEYLVRRMERRPRDGRCC